MGNSHYFVTSYVTGYNGTEEIAAFEAVLKSRFQKVEPFYGAFVMWSKDFANCEAEAEMPVTIAALSGILTHDTAIVAAWDHPQAEDYQNRQRLWLVPGKDSLQARMPPEKEDVQL